MTELRLVPAAASLWLVILVTIATGTGRWGLATLVILTLSVVVIDRGQALVIISFMSLGLVITTSAVAQVRGWHWEPVLYAVAQSSGQPSSAGWLQQFTIADYPTSLPVFFETQQHIPVGAHVQLHGSTMQAHGIGLNRTLFFADNATIIHPPNQIHTISQTIRSTFAQTVAKYCGDDAQALIPAMVLGDTSGQSLETKQLFITSGLAHLSAVSGANVAMVTTAATVIAGWFRPGIRVTTAVLALVCYVTVVGVEPSVLRAAVTGIIGMIALMSATVRSAINALAISVIGLLLYDVSLATNFGFALSVAATAGIITVTPGLYRFISKKKMPDILAKALSIALAAHLVTMPLVAIMSHQISTIAVFANVATAAVVAPITIIGLLAVLLCLVSAPLAGALLKIIEPLAWWIGAVARWCAHLPGATYDIDTPLAPLWAILVSLWIIYLLYTQRFALLLGLSCFALCAPSLNVLRDHPQPVDLTTLRVVQLETDAGLKNHSFAPAQLIVINQPPPTPSRWNRTLPRPKITPEGIPIAYRLADGRLSIMLYDNGEIQLVDQTTVK
jgi:hypothetical protein